MSSSTKLPTDLLTSVATLGEFVLGNRVQNALTAAQRDVWGAKGKKLLPDLQRGLTAITQAVGVVPDFNKHIGIEGAFSVGDIPEELRAAVRQGLTVATSLAGADGTTYELFQSIEEWLKIKPIRTDDAHAERNSGVSQTLAVIAQEVGKISSTYMPATGDRGGKGARAVPGTKNPSFGAGNAIKATKVPYVGTICAQDGSGPPYSVDTLGSAEIYLTPESGNSRAFNVVAIPASGKNVATASVLLTDGSGKSAPVVFAVDFSDGAPATGPRDGHPVLTREGSGVLDATKSPTPELVFLGRQLPADREVVVTTGAPPQKGLAPPNNTVPFAHTEAPDKSDPLIVRIKVWIGLEALDDTTSAQNIYVCITSKGKVVAFGQAQYIKPSPKPQPTGLKPTLLSTSGTLTVTGSNLDYVDAPRLILTAKGSSTVTVQAILDTTGLLVADLSTLSSPPSAGRYSVALASGSLSVAPWSLGPVVLTNPLATPVGFLLPGVGEPVPYDTFPVNASPRKLQLVVSDAVAGAIASLQKMDDPGSAPQTIGTATSATSPLDVTLDEDVLADMGTYTVRVDNPKPIDPTAAPSVPAVMVVVAKPAVTGPTRTTIASGGEIAFTGVSFSEEAKAHAVAHDAHGKKLDHIKAIAKITGEKAGIITVSETHQAIHKLVVNVTNPANAAKTSNDVTSEDFTISVGPPASPSTEPPPPPPSPPSPSPGPHGHNARAREALAHKLIELVRSEEDNKPILQEAKPWFKTAGLGDAVFKEFERSLPSLRNLDPHELKERVDEILEKPSH
jgi:hypothetical protein